jgi:hypothetical protein
MQSKMARWGLLFALLAGLIASAAIPGLIVREAGATHEPADKIGVSASTIEVMSTPLFAGASSEEVELLRGSLKTSSPTDLSLSVHAECALWTDVTVTSTGTSSSTASVKVWVEVDGVAVPVTNEQSSGGPDDGRVVFCNRQFTLDLIGLPGVISLFERTRSANAFQWMDLNVGPGVHTVVVKAQLEANVTATGFAQAGVGKRTLIVEPVKLANDATF